jgi:hypothetical protein
MISSDKKINLRGSPFFSVALCGQLLPSDATLIYFTFECCSRISLCSSWFFVAFVLQKIGHEGHDGPLSPQSLVFKISPCTYLPKNPRIKPKKELAPETRKNTEI